MSESVEAGDVRHIAELARVELSDDEVEQFREEFAAILGYFDRLDEVPEVDREDDQTNVFRPDDPREGLSQDEALANAEATEDGFFKGPPVG